jgi:hypothetical protein
MPVGGAARAIVECNGARRAPSLRAAIKNEKMTKLEAR